jgi:O-methyltransferase involved in polyketide biosynthesis
MKPIIKKNKKYLFLAEGLFMYLQEKDVKQLVLNLQHNFPGCHLVSEMANTFIIKTLKRKIWRKKFQRDFYLGKDATFIFGIKDSRDLELWNKGVEFLDEWTYFDDKENKLGWINYLGRIEKFRKTQWIVHYKLN